MTDINYDKKYKKYKLKYINLRLEQEGGMFIISPLLHTQKAIIIGIVNVGLKLIPQGTISRGILRTGTGTVADVLSLGVGGDELVDLIFALQSMANFVKDHKLKKIIEELDKHSSHTLFTKEPNSVLGYKSAIPLKNGLTEFRKQYEIIMINNHKKIPDKIYKEIINYRNKITTVITDWIACLFPDTAGTIGTATKLGLDKHVKDGFTYLEFAYNKMPKTVQDMLCKSDLLISHIEYMFNILNTIFNDPKINSEPSFTDKTKKMVIDNIKNHVTNYNSDDIIKYVNTFYQLWGLFLILSLLLESHHKEHSQHHDTPHHNTPKYDYNGTHKVMLGGCIL